MAPPSASASSSPVTSPSPSTGDVEPSSDVVVVVASSPPGPVASSPGWPFWPLRAASPASSPGGPPRSSTRRLERPHPSARLTTAQSPIHHAFHRRPSATGAVGHRLPRESRRSIDLESQQVSCRFKRAAGARDRRRGAVANYYGSCQFRCSRLSGRDSRSQGARARYFPSSVCIAAIAWPALFSAAGSSLPGKYWMIFIVVRSTM